jgi:integrase
MRSGVKTFVRKSDAVRYLTIVESQLAQGEWLDPVRAKVRLGDYAERWIEERPGLRPRTKDLYRSLLRHHVAPLLGDIPLGRIDTPLVREWRARLLVAGVSATVAAKAYRLLRAVLMTAVNEDRILPRNPCRLRGADKETAGERPVLSVAEVLALADVVPLRCRALILVTVFGSLRFGEVTALQRRDVDLGVGVIRVRRAFAEVPGEGLIIGEPKSAAGRRTVTIPPMVAGALREHLTVYAGPEPSALVFTLPGGGAIRRGSVHRALRWKEATAKLGLTGLRFHDLRHTGNTLAAQSGVSTRDLMARMGHDSVRAALIYQHATTEADARIAEALEAAIERATARQAVGAEELDERPVGE